MHKLIEIIKRTKKVAKIKTSIKNERLKFIIIVDHRADRVALYFGSGFVVVFVQVRNVLFKSNFHKLAEFQSIWFELRQLFLITVSSKQF